MDFKKITLVAMRVTLGWLYFYAGITKVLDPSWTSAGYLAGAKTFAGFYTWLAQPGIMPVIDFTNKWGLTLLGISLILGLGVRLSSVLGALLMALYYLPILDFPYPNAHAFIVDEHIVYITVLLFLSAKGAGRFWGLDEWCANLPICAKFPKLRKLIG